MASDSQDQLNDDTYTALGRFVVAFSRLLYALETSTVHLLDLGPDGRRMALIQAALSDRTAGPIVSAFFSVFFERWKGCISQEDLQILRHLRRELVAVVETRNRLMHDVWMGVTVGGDPGPHPMARYRVRAHGSGVDFESVSCQPAELGRLAADLDRLSSVVNASVWYHRPGQVGPELHPRLGIRDGKVSRASDSSE